jgi:5-methylcytosine-specific restriction endonuclease McrA
MGYRKKNRFQGGGFHNAFRRTREDQNHVYKRFRTEIRKRDKHCKMPGCNAIRLLQVHHILPWACAPYLRYEPRNAITLCKKCHDSIKGKEEHYIELFSRIVERMYDNPNG